MKDITKFTRIEVYTFTVCHPHWLLIDDKTPFDVKVTADNVNAAIKGLKENKFTKIKLVNTERIVKVD